MTGRWMTARPGCLAAGDARHLRHLLGRVRQSEQQRRLASREWHRSFKLVEYVPNTRIVLERNENYWEEGSPYLDGIEMTIASDDTARTAAVVTGTVDFIEYAPLRISRRSRQTPASSWPANRIPTSALLDST